MALLMQSCRLLTSSSKICLLKRSSNIFHSSYSTCARRYFSSTINSFRLQLPQKLYNPRKGIACSFYKTFSSKVHVKKTKGANHHNIAEDTVLYESPYKVIHRYLAVIGALTALFCFEGAQVIYILHTHKLMKSPKMEGNTSWMGKFTNASGYILTTALTITGLVAFTTCVIMPLRFVLQLVLLRGGNNIRIKTYSHLRGTRQLDFPLGSVSLGDHSRSFINLKVEGRNIKFLVDKQDGFFVNPELSTQILGRSAWTKK